MYNKQHLLHFKIKIPSTSFYTKLLFLFELYIHSLCHRHNI